MTDIQSITNQLKISVDDFFRNGAQTFGYLSGQTVQFIKHIPSYINQDCSIAVAVFVTSNAIFLTLADTFAHKLDDFIQHRHPHLTNNQRIFKNIALNGVVVGGAVAVFNYTLASAVLFPLSPAALVAVTVTSVIARVLLNHKTTLTEKQLLAKVVETKQQLEIAEKQLENAQNQLKAEQEKLNDSLSEEFLSPTSAFSQEEVEALQDNLKEAQSKKESLQEELDTLQSLVKTLQSKIDTEGEIEAKEKESEELQLKIAELETQVYTAQSSKTQAQSKVKELKETQQQMLLEITSLKEKLLEYKTTISSLSDELAHVKKQRNEAADQLKSVTELMEEMKSKGLNLAACTKTLILENTEKTKKIKKVQEELKTSQEELKTSQNYVTILEEEAKNVENQLLEKDELIASLQTSLASAKKKPRTVTPKKTSSQQVQDTSTIFYCNVENSHPNTRTPRIKLEETFSTAIALSTNEEKVQTL